MESEFLSWLEPVLNFGVPLALLALGYGVGNYREKKHYRSIKIREARLLKLQVSSLKPGAGDLKGCRGQLVSGNAVIANDYFKTFVSNLRNFFGGRMKSFETLIDRARREAVLRMLREAELLKASRVVNLRIETSTIGAQKNASSSVEVFAYATALFPEP